MLPINYGWNLHDDYIDAGEEIVQDFDDRKISRIVEKINNTFFDGAVFDIKDFSSLLSVHIPRHPWVIMNDERGRCIEIKKQVSISALLGYIEAIPVIGSALAIINSIGHLFYMLVYYRALKHAIVQLKAIERNEHNMRRGASCHFTGKVFDAAVAYSVHRNHLAGSLLSIVPLAKPIVRFAQGALHNPAAQAVN